MRTKFGLVASAFVILLTLMGCTRSREQLVGDGLIALEGAVLIDGTGSAPRPNSVVVIQGEQIVRVGVVGQFSYPPDAQVIGLAGRWIVPGFIDTHAHMPDPEDQEDVLKLLVAFGITSVRSPAADPSSGTELRARIDRGETLGPRLRTAGRLIDAPGGIFSGWAAEVTSVEEIRTEVRRQADAGVDFIKLYRGLGPDLVEAAINEAHALGLRVIGHLGGTMWSEAVAFGIDGLAHFGIYGTPWELAPDADRPAIRRACDHCENPGDEEGLRILRATLRPDGPDAVRWAGLLAEGHATVEPNLVLLRAVFWGENAEVLAEMEPEYAPASWRDGHWFDAVPHPYRAPCTAEWASEAKALYPLFEDLVSLLNREGAVLTVGTDLMNPWMTPGVSYHREMELLAAAGLTSQDVLIAATRNGAIALGLEGEVGVIRQGTAADLVVLKSDPEADIRNTRAIESVYLRGAVLRPSDLLSSR